MKGYWGLAGFLLAVLLYCAILVLGVVKLHNYLQRQSGFPFKEKVQIGISPDRQYYEAQQIIKENKEATKRAEETMERWDELYKFTIKGDKIYYGPDAVDFMGFRNSENDRTPILRVDQNKICNYLIIYKANSTHLFYYGNRDVDKYWSFNLQPEDNWQFKFCDKNDPAMVTIYDKK